MEHEPKSPPLDAATPDTARGSVRPGRSSDGFFVGLGLLCIAIALGGPPIAGWLVYDRDAVLSGQIWRLGTGDLVHLGGRHLLWNLAGLAIVWVAFAPALGPGGWLAAGLAAAFGSSLGLLLLDPGIRNCSGLSAVLHGLLAAGALGELRRGHRGIGLAFLGLLTVKLAGDRIYGPNPASAALLGGGIAVSAHLFGAIGGLAAGAFAPLQHGGPGVAVAEAEGE